MDPAFLLVTYCLLIVVVSLFGGWLPSVMKLSHLKIQMLMSLVGGMMIGISLLHLLPHAAEFLGDPQWISGSVMAGILSMLFLLRFGHVHSHGDSGSTIDHDHEHDQAHEFDDHHHDHDDPAVGSSSESHTLGCAHPGHHHDPGHTAKLSWVGLFVGLALHTLFDGVALGASVVAEAAHGHGGEFALFGLGTFLAVALHKPMDALAITSVMQAANWSPTSRTIANVCFALACPLGALVFWFGTSNSPGANQFVGCALGFSAGAFLCIALTDLVPEAMSHDHDKVKLSAALLVGCLLAVLIEMLPGHSHSHLHTKPPTSNSWNWKNVTPEVAEHDHSQLVR